MHTIVLIGKDSEELQSVYRRMQSGFKVHLSTEGHKHALSLIKAMKPDLIVIDLAGLGTMDRSLLIEIRQDFPDTPVLTLGTDTEKLPFASFHWEKQFRHVLRTADNETLYTTACTLLKLDQKGETGQQVDEDERKKVLVVDDDPTMLRSIKSMLENKFQVTIANSGMKALKSIGKNRPDVILLDYEMPVCDGRQTLAMIRSDEDIADIPVIFLTSVNDKEMIHAVLELLPAGYLLKPPIPGRLIDTIQKALQAGK